MMHDDHPDLHSDFVPGTKTSVPHGRKSTTNLSNLISLNVSFLVAWRPQFTSSMAAAAPSSSKYPRYSNALVLV